MASQTTAYDVQVNNAALTVEGPTIAPKRLLAETGFHPGSYALFTDAYADAEDAPAAFDERLGERLSLDAEVDLSEHRRFIAVLKRNL